VILDSSAIVGIVLREPGFETLVRKLTQAEAVAVGAPTLVETGIVLTARLGRDARGLFPEDGPGAGVTAGRLSPGPSLTDDGGLPRGLP
jgi:hypothetical protein